MSDEPAPDRVPRLLALGDAAWIVDFGGAIDVVTHARVMGLARALEVQQHQGLWPTVLEWVPAYTSLTVFFDTSAPGDPMQQAAAPLLALAQSAPALLQAGRRWRLPVCFDADCAPDLHELAQARGLSTEAVIASMTATTFRVYMLGFQPGFPYMGGLPATLELPRRSTPRTAVPERSLAVAGRMCAVYPWRSPGGWHLVGRTPVKLFDADHAGSAAWLRAGDEVNWQAVDRSRYEELLQQAAGAGLVRRDWLLA